MPPRVVRRLVLLPLVLLVELALLLVSPVLVLVAALVSPFLGGWRPLRATLVTLAFVSRHAAALVACFALWVAGGMRRTATSQRERRSLYELMAWFVGGVFRDIVRLARVEVRVSESEAAGAVLSAKNRPVILLGRHAGEGDTLLVLFELLCPHRRGPRIVLHERLRLDPLIDLLGGRLPNRFVDPRGGDVEGDIALLAAGLNDNDALVIFPEGANFSQAARERANARLQEGGHDEWAASARAMAHVSPPRPGGTLAAIDAAPGADVVVLGHAGFPVGVREVWRDLPRRQVIDVRLWHQPAETLPREHAAQIDWLLERWRELDAWVGERQPAPAAGR
ncbi:MAG: hypothetical protein M3370_00075 [Actinomycetota bacterium]|nr:hypothetical protein [Actinomycetota bacterium]